MCDIAADREGTVRIERVRERCSVVYDSGEEGLMRAEKAGGRGERWVWRDVREGESQRSVTPEERRDRAT